MNKTDPLGLRATDDDDRFEPPPPPDPCGPYRQDHRGYMWLDLESGNCVVLDPALRGTASGPGGELTTCVQEVGGGWGRSQEVIRACRTAAFYGQQVLGWDFSLRTAGEHNAMRHFVWASLISYEVGAELANVPLINHEAYGVACPSTPAECRADDNADYVNNEAGRHYGASLLHKYGGPHNVFGWGMDEEALIQDVVQKGYQYLRSGVLNTGGGCPEFVEKHGLGFVRNPPC